MSGWIKLHRTLQNWGWKKSPKHLAVFIDLLLEANHTDGEYRGVKIPRGSLTTSIKAISNRTGVPVKSVMTVLRHLKSTNEVAINPSSQFTMISISKWTDYQVKGEPADKQVANEGQTTGKQVATNKNVIIKEAKKQAAIEVLEYFNKVCGKALGPTDFNLNCIIKRLKEGYSMEDFKLVVDDLNKEWASSDVMKRHLNPGTVFSGKFDGYLQSAKSALKPKFDPLMEFAHKHLGDSIFISNEEGKQ